MDHLAFLSQTLSNGDVMCLACAHACRLKEGEYGICGVRQVQKEKLILLTYGRAAAINVDPIEKKPLFHFLPNTKTFSLGTVGCNLSCTFCQNYTLSQYPKEHEHRIVGETLNPEQIITLAQQHQCASIAYTYNEPVVSFEYTYDTALLAKENGLKNIYVTSGFETKKATKLLSSCIDAMNIDLKSFSDSFYTDVCNARLKPILETIAYAHTLGIWVEITTLIIPGLNDTQEELRQIAEFLASIDTSIPWHISAFHPMYKMTDRPPTPASTLMRAYTIAQEAGLKHVYVGNIDDHKHTSTYCPKCQTCVIERHGYIGQFVTNHLTQEGICPSCGNKLEGVWR